MKKALIAFSVLIFISTLLIVGSMYYLYNFDFAMVVNKLLDVWNSLRRFAQYYPWNIAKITVTAAFGIIFITSFFVLVKVIRLRKPFVSYFTFLNLVFLDVIGVLAFIPYLPEWHLGNITLATTLPAAIMAIIADPATMLKGYILAGTIGAFILFDILFILISFIDIARSPFPLKHIRRKAGKKGTKEEPNIVADEFGKFQVPVDGRVDGRVEKPSPSIQEIRRAVKEEIAPTLKAQERMVEPTPAPSTIPAPANGRTFSLEEVRSIIRDELDRAAKIEGNDSFKSGPAMYAAPWMQGGYPQYPAPGYFQQPAPQGVVGVTREDVRSIVSLELEKTAPNKKEMTAIVEQEVTRLSPTSKEVVYSIVNEELIKYDALNREALDSLVAEKIDKFSSVNKESAKTVLNEELGKYDVASKAALRAILAQELEKIDAANKLAMKTIITEELAKLSTKVEETKLAALSGEQIKTLIVTEVGKVTVPQTQELRKVFAEELSAYAAAKKAAGPTINAEEVKKIASEVVAKATITQPLKNEELISIITNEVKKSAPVASVDEERVHQIIALEIKKLPLTSSVKMEEVTSLINAEVKKATPVSTPINKDQIHDLVVEEMDKYQLPKVEEIRKVMAEELASHIAARKSAPTPVVEVKATPTLKPPVESPKPTDDNPFFKGKPTPFVNPVTMTLTPEVKPILPVVEEEIQVKAKQVFERIAFEIRMKHAAKDLLGNYNEIKNYILSYGVKSRVSNSGDTFRLHTETYMKITIAGKGLKLYFALDPKKYEGSTIPVSSAGHKSLYAEIPCVLKVKSPLSVKRALQLVDDMMKEKGQEQGEIPSINWARDFH